MEKTRTFAKNSLIYFLGKALTLLVTIFLLPLYTSKISTDNYGYYELVRSILNVLLPFVCMEMWSGVFRLFYWKKSEDYPKQLFASSFYYCCVCALLIGLGFAIAGLIGSTKDWFFSILLVFSEMISFLFTYYARSLKKNLAFSLSGIFASLANATVGIISVTLFSLQEEAMFLALICGFLVQDIILFFWLKLWRYLSIKNFSFSVLKDIIKFSWPFGISTLLYYLSNGFVSLLIGLYISTSAVAIYSMAMKFMSVIVLAAGIFSMSWTDIIYAVDDEQQRRSLIEHWADRFCRFFCILSICSMAFIQLAFPILVGTDYQSAYQYLPYLLISSYFDLSSNIFINPLNSENKPWLNIVVKLAGDVIVISLFFSLFSTFGLLAAIIAFSGGEIAVCCTAQFLDTKVLKLHLSWRPTFVFLFLYIIAGLAFYYLDPMFNLAISFCCFLFGLFYCRDIYELLIKKVSPENGVRLNRLLANSMTNLGLDKSNRGFTLGLKISILSFVISFLSGIVLSGKNIYLSLALMALSIILSLTSYRVFANNKKSIFKQIKDKKFFFFCYSFLFPLLFFILSGLAILVLTKTVYWPSGHNILLFIAPTISFLLYLISCYRMCNVTQKQ